MRGKITNPNQVSKGENLTIELPERELYCTVLLTNYQTILASEGHQTDVLCIDFNGESIDVFRRNGDDERIFLGPCTLKS